MTSVLVRASSRNLDRLTKALQAAGDLFTLGEMKEIGKAGVADARNAIRRGSTPDGKPWKLTRDGRTAYGNSASMKRAIRAVIWSRSTLTIESDDVRSVVANQGRSTGTLVRHAREAIVPLTRAIERRKNAAGGWSKMRAFKIRTKNGNVFLAQRREGSRTLTLLGIFKKVLKQYRRQHFGEGQEIRAVAQRLGARLVSSVQK